MKENIKKFIKDNHLLKKDSTVIVGFSGGPDSVCLLNILNELKSEFSINLIAAHLDHGWRKESFKDVEFCIKLCDKLNIKLISKKASELNFEFKETGSKEDLGRKMRRFFFENTAKEFNAETIALGQHLQDQEENFFIRLIRGTSLSGLTGIKAKETTKSGFNYIRPLIETNKNEILNYLKENKLEFLIDPTNVDESYLRNKIRKHIIPNLQECDTRFDSNFLKTLHKLNEANNFIEDFVEQEFNKIYKNEELNSKKLLEVNSYIQKRILIYWLIQNNVQFNISEKFLYEILKFIKSKHGGTHQLHENWSIEKKQGQLKIIRIS